MLKFEFAKVLKRPVSVLCLGAHSDDIEIGCGGTLLRLLSMNRNVEVQWVVLGSSGVRDAEALVSARRFLRSAKKKNITVHNFKDGFFPYVGEEIKRYFEVLKKRIQPDIIFTHYRQDLHQDHRIVSELTWNTFRDHMIFEYEIVKYDGDFGNPNTFVHLEPALCQKKIKIILDSFRTQVGRRWFSEDAFNAVLRLRGIESNAPAGYAEGFYVRKVVI